MAAVVSIDDRAIAGLEHRVALEPGRPTELSVVVRARGYRSWRKKLKIDGESAVELNVEVKLRKARETAQPPGGGLIDL